MVSKKRGALDVISPEWRAKLGLDVTTQKQPEDVNPTAVASTLVESRTDTDQTNETNKVNTAIGDPTGVTISEKVLVDGVAGTRAKTIVAENASLPAVSHLTVDSKQRAWGTGLAEQEVTSVSAWPSRAGQEYDPLFEFLIPYTKQLKALGSNVGDAYTDSRPIDHKTSEVTVYSPPGAAIADKVYQYPQVVTFDVPDELLSLEAVWETSTGGGGYEMTGSGTTAGTTAAISIAPRARANGSTSAIPDIVPEDRVCNGRQIAPVFHFFLGDTVTEGAIASRLTTLFGSTVNVMPYFKPQRLRLVLQGTKVAVEASAELNISLSVSNSTASYATSEGQGAGADVGNVLRVVTLGPYIHDTIVITGDVEKTVGITVAVEAENTAGGDWPGASASASGVGSATGSIVGYQLEATTPSSVPSSGYYAIPLNIEPWKFGYVMVRAAVIDASKI